MTVKIDDSERTRLERTRNKLLLNHWTKIKPSYVIEQNLEVAKKIQELEHLDPVLHDEKYSDWQSRYSDLTMEWQKKRDPDTGIIYGILVASGRMRFKGLGLISKGCTIEIMTGKMNNDPLPSTKVADLRVMHLNLQIDFNIPVKKTNPDHADNYGTSFKVGKNNFLYEEDERQENLHAHKKRETDKMEKQTKEIMNSLMKNFLDLTTKAKEENENGTNGGDTGDDDPAKQVGRDSGRHNARSLSSDNAGFGTFQFNNKFNSAGARQDCMDLVRQFTGGNKVPHSTSNPDLTSITDEESDSFSEALGGGGSPRDPASSHSRNDADDDDQVSYINIA